MWLSDHIFLGESSLSPLDGDVRFTLLPELKRDTPALYRLGNAMTSLYAEQDAATANLTQLLYGEPFEVHHTAGNMAYGRSLCDGYVGWLALDSLAPNWMPPTHMVCVPLAPLYQSPHLKQSPLMLLPMTAMLNATGSRKNGYIELEGGGWIFNKHVSEEPDSDRSLVDIASLFIGQPYIWGGRTAEGIDCSGLLQTSLALMGLRCHRDSDGQYKTMGQPIERSDLQTGDIAFFPGHVGIMVDGDNVLHANATHMAVSVDPLDDVISWVAKDTDKEPFLGGKRL